MQLGPIMERRVTWQNSVLKVQYHRVPTSAMTSYLYEHRLKETFPLVESRGGLIDPV